MAQSMAKRVWRNAFARKPALIVDQDTAGTLPQRCVDHDDENNHIKDSKAIVGGPSIVDTVNKEPSPTTINKIEEASPVPVTEDDSLYIGGSKLVALTFGLAMATFVVALDNTIIATAIPRITAVFKSTDDVGWYGSAYLLTTTSLQPLFGKIYVYYDIKWVYLSALIIFEVGSILCAAATSSTMLIVGRAVAGAGAAALFSGGMTIVGYSVALRKRALYIAALSSMFGISSVVGPILGGRTRRLSFCPRPTADFCNRWCFWINLPFGGVALAAVFFFFSNPPRKHADMSFREKLKHIDIVGAFVLIGAIVCLLLALQWGGTTYAWNNSKIWGCFLGFGLILLLFIAIQIYLGDRATLPPRIFGNRNISAIAIFSALLAMGIYTHVYYLPFYFQGVKGTSAEGSGIRTIPYLVSVTVASIVVGASITVLGPYNPPMWIGAITFTVGAGLLYILKADSSAGRWIGYQIVAGAGAGACVQIPFIAIQVVLDEKDMPVGNAIAIFFNTLGGAISVSIAQNIFSNTLVKEITRNVPQINPQTLLMAGVGNYTMIVPDELYTPVVTAYNDAITTAFILPIATAGMAFLASLFMEWKSVKGRSLIPGGA